MLPELHDCTACSTKASASQGGGPAVIHRGWRQAVLSPWSNYRQWSMRSHPRPTVRVLLPSHVLGTSKVTVATIMLLARVDS